MPETRAIPFSSYKGDAPHIFISYAHKDSSEVFSIIKRFNDMGFHIWYDEGIEPGNEWPMEIERALKSSGLFLVFISPHSVRSRNVRNEINFALSLNIPFVAIYLEETELIEGLGLQMGSTQAIMKYRMEEASFYDKSESVFNQMLGMEAPAVHDAPNKHGVHKKRSGKKAALLGGGAAVLLIILSILWITLLSGGTVEYKHTSLGLSFSHPKGWEVTDETNGIIMLHNNKKGMEIYIIDMTDMLVMNLAAGHDIIEATELTAVNYAERMAYYEEVFEYMCRVEYNTRMILEGMGNFLYNAEGGELYVDSTCVEFTITLLDNRMFLYALSMPPYDSGKKRYDYKDYEVYKAIYNDIMETLTIEGNHVSIETRVADLQNP